MGQQPLRRDDDLGAASSGVRDSDESRRSVEVVASDVDEGTVRPPPPLSLRGRPGAVAVFARTSALGLALEPADGEGCSPSSSVAPTS